jgi:hypothetical protein
MENLWSGTIDVPKTIPPVTILRQQATMLGQTTKGILQAEVKHYNEEFSKGFVYDFLILAPALGNYKYQLLEIRHDVELYPVKIETEKSIGDDVVGKLNTAGINSAQSSDGWVFTAKTEEDLMEVLKVIFRSNKSKEVIASLIAQSSN